MARVFRGGSKTYSDESVPETEEEVVKVLQRFIRDMFKDPAVADEIVEKDDQYMMFFADEEQTGSPSKLTNDGELVAYGSMIYLAKEHSVQTIWENQFIIRDTEGGVFVRVSNWYGTTVGSWQEKIEKQSLYV